MDVFFFFVYVRDERWKTDISGKEENPNFPDLV
jgi:hypothetical protein